MKRNGRHLALALFGVALVLAFGLPLSRLLRLATHSDMYSHVMLVPLISCYLVWIRRSERSSDSSLAWPRSALIPPAAGALALAAWLVLHRQGGDPVDMLSASIAAFVSLLLCGIAASLGGPFFRAHAFALFFLYAMAPLPVRLEHALNALLQRATAEATHAMLALSGTPLYREGLVFQLPGLAIEVAEECSGIRSTLVLFLTSLIAANLFLQRRWTRVALVAAVLPIAVARNAFRIVTLSLLTIHVDARIIEGPLHREGGPLFFVLSLAVLMAVLWPLRRAERGRDRPQMLGGIVRT